MGLIYKGSDLNFSHIKRTNPDGRHYPLHVHNDYEMLCFIKGNASYIVEGREYVMSQGSLMLMRPAESHRLKVRGKGEYERYVINFTSELLVDYGISPGILSAFNDRGLGESNQYLASEFCGIEPLGIFRQIEKECECLDSPREAIALNLAALMCAVNTAFRNKKNREAEMKMDAVDRALMDYVNQNLTGELSLESVSDYVHVSPSQVNRIFKRLTGTSVYDYVLTKRLVMAQELIASGEGAMAASQRCGFKDYSSFYRLYKKRTGTFPGAAKKK